MNPSRFIASLLFVCSAPSALFSGETGKITSTDEKITQLNFLLPINWANEDKYDLSVEIPDNFEPIQKLSLWVSGQIPMIEFIPKGETSTGWSEIITLNMFLNKNVSAEQLVKFLQEKMVTQLQNVKVWHPLHISRDKEFLSAEIGIAYDLSGQREIFGCRYYSGPYDCSGVQYTIRPKKGQPQDEVSAKIDAFFQNHTKVIPKTDKKTVAPNM